MNLQNGDPLSLGMWWHWPSCWY